MRTAATAGRHPQYGSGSYVNPLPSVQLRYTLDNDSDIRAVYGRGISRPDPYQLVPYIVFTTQGGPSGINLVQIGNTGLVAEHANDFDVLYERFLPSVGMLQGGYFYKQITQANLSPAVDRTRHGFALVSAICRGLCAAGSQWRPRVCARLRGGISAALKQPAGGTGWSTDKR